MNVPDNLLYTESHEWVRRDGDEITVGLTDFAQQQLSDLTYVELPAVDESFKAGDEVAVVESVKAASDIYAPVDGTISEINEDLEDNPELINRSPYEEGWIFKMKADNPDDIEGLMSPEDYEELAPDEE